jgi:hypothetical protein
MNSKVTLVKDNADSESEGTLGGPSEGTVGGPSEGGTSHDTNYVVNKLLKVQ